MPSPSRIVLAPDSFKGSATARQVAAALRDGILGVEPAADVRCLPIADGGEGTLDVALTRGWQGQRAAVAGPWGDPVEAQWAMAPGGDEALVELAAASGIALPVQAHRPTDDATRALAASSRGTGEVIAAALDAGCRRVVVGVGGSACSDGGLGMLRALGAVVRDQSGQQVPDGVVGLERAASVDLAPARELLTGVELVLAADVTNPLVGPQGAAAVYGPQKGADEDRRPHRDGARPLEGRADARRHGPCARPGAGAAGGVGFALLALGARRVSGVEHLLDLAGIDSALRDADLVVTGEGRLDSQTLHGKAPAGVLGRARAAGVPVVAVCGTSALTPSELRRAGFDRVLALTDREPDVARCLADPVPLLREVGRDLARGCQGHA
ncbi:glycerate kinase [Kytococcus sedentarius]|uniref:glycerate kinase n=1 Tax=Kytococcus sedentarius TaxID=1276 RepID=UPI0035BC93D3